MSKKESNIIMTGGHAATTALATIEEIIRRKSNVKIYWIGSRRAMEGKRVPSLESSIFPKSGVEFKPIITGRLQRKFSIWTISSLLRIPFGFIHALVLLIKIKPKLVVSFGGFAAFPVVVGSWILRMPVVIHEQTTAAGRGNKLSSIFASKIALAREESREYFPKNKTVLVGNPILTQIAEIKQKEKNEEPPVIYVTGGSRGSTIINSLIFRNLEEVLEKYYLIHQVGYIDEEKAKGIKQNLPKRLKERYEVYSIIDPMQVDGVYKRTDLVISRAGANTVSEVIATKRPAIFIPIPWSYANEQEKNAKFAQKWGIVKIISQDAAKGKKLTSLIKEVLNKKEKMVSKKKDFNLDKEASGKFVDLIEEYIA